MVPLDPWDDPSIPEAAPKPPCKRSFFRKAKLAVPRVKPAPKPKVDYRGKVVIVKRESGIVTAMAARTVASQLGSLKGGRTTGARGSGGRFTSETGRKAVKKTWKTRWRFIKRIGTRIGRGANQRKRINHVELRAYYSTNFTKGLRYLPSESRWELSDEFGIRPIGEMAALQRLGHLPKRNGTYANDIIDPDYKARPPVTPSEDADVRPCDDFTTIDVLGRGGMGHPAGGQGE